LIINLVYCLVNGVLRDKDLCKDYKVDEHGSCTCLIPDICILLRISKKFFEAIWYPGGFGTLKIDQDYLHTKYLLLLSGDLM